MKWTDITNPTESYIKNLNEQFKLPEGCLQSFLKANAQPTYQVIGFCKILVLRAVEDQLKNNADSIHDLTRKIVIIETTHNQGQELWTLHHRPITWLESYYSTQPSDLIVQTLLQKTLQTFQTILDQDQKFLFDYQNHVFSIKKRNNDLSNSLKKAHFIKRRISALQLILDQTLTLLDTHPDHDSWSPLKNDLEYIHTKNHMHDNELHDLLQIQFAITSQKTNEVMQFLTVFSAVFLPLALLTGIYGMNFEHIPGTHEHHGFALFVGLLLVLGILIYLYFRNKGWTKI